MFMYILCIHDTDIDMYIMLLNEENGLFVCGKWLDFFVHAQNILHVIYFVWKIFPSSSN